MEILLPKLETIATIQKGRAVTATLDSPPANFMGARLISDLIDLFDALEESPARVLVLQSGNPRFFSARADIVDVPGYTAAASRAGGPEDHWLGTFLRRITDSRLVTIAKLRGRVGGAGSELALACDMRFASREKSSFCQPELAVGLTPGSGAMQHLTRLMGRGRALEVLLSSGDFDAGIAERYGWVNRAIQDDDLDSFVDNLASTIARFPSRALATAKDRVNQIALPDIEEVRNDAKLFQKFAKSSEVHARMAQAKDRGFLKDLDIEDHLGQFLGELPELP